jgi:hypothetical protein
MNTFAIARVTKGSNVSKQTTFLVDEAPSALQIRELKRL